MLVPNIPEIDDYLKRINAALEGTHAPDKELLNMIDSCRKDYVAYLVGCQVQALIAILITNQVIAEDEYSAALESIQEGSQAQMSDTAESLKMLATFFRKDES